VNGYIIAAIATAVFGAGFYVGNLRGDVKTDTCKTAAAVSTAAQATTVTQGLITDRSQEAAQAASDHKADETHAQDNRQIDSAPPRTDPVFVQSGPARSAVCPSAVPGHPGTAGPNGANPADGGSGASGGDSDNRRPEIEALKKRLERISADYRDLRAHWPANPKETP
jgi:hypothetical protein